MSERMPSGEGMGSGAPSGPGYSGSAPGPAVPASGEYPSRGWRPIASAPRDGTPFWAWLYDSGIRKIAWWSVEDLSEAYAVSPDMCQEGFYEDKSDDEWCPRFWMPFDAIPQPPAPGTETAAADETEGLSPKGDGPVPAGQAPDPIAQARAEGERAGIEKAARAALGAQYGNPSSWPDGGYPRGWRHPPSWEPDQKPTPTIAAWHDNGARDAYIAIRAVIRALSPDQPGRPDLLREEVEGRR